MRHHAHVAGEYTTENGEARFFEVGQYICTYCTKCNLQLSFNKKNYRLPVYFHNGSHYYFMFIMKLILTMPGDLEVIPTTEDKEMQIEYNGIQFKDSLKLISSPLRSIVAQTLGGNLDLYKRVLEAEKKEDAVIEGSFKRINTRGFNVSTKEQTKTLMTCTDNKGWILDDNIHTRVFGHYRLKDI